jgi:hypothetical protein
MIAVVSLVVCCTIALVSFPSGQIYFHDRIDKKYDASRTIEYQFDCIADAVSDPQKLGRRHPNFLLC